MDIGKILLAALAGGSKGAAGGSLIPNIGTLAGGIGGALLGGGGTLLDQLFGGGEFTGGTPSRAQQVSTVTPQQQQLLNQLLGQGQSMLQNPYQGFEDVRNQVLQQYQQQILPMLSEQFAGLGENRLSSPSFAQQVGQSGSQLATNLGYLQNQYGRQNQQQALNMINTGLTPQFQNVNVPGQAGLIEQLLPTAAKLAPVGLSAAFAPQGQSQQAAFDMLKAIYGG